MLRFGRQLDSLLLNRTRKNGISERIVQLARTQLFEDFGNFLHENKDKSFLVMYREEPDRMEIIVYPTTETED